MLLRVLSPNILRPVAQPDTYETFLLCGTVNRNNGLRSLFRSVTPLSFDVRSFRISGHKNELYGSGVCAAGSVPDRAQWGRRLIELDRELLQERVEQSGELSDGKLFSSRGSRNIGSAQDFHHIER